MALELDSLLVKIVLPLAILGGAGWYLHHQGVESGQAEIQALWNKDKADRDEATAQLKSAYAQKERTNAEESNRAALALQKASDDHQAELAALKRDYAQRLLDSQARAAIYQRQAASSPAECQRLASHTAELDRSLEEGRSLVRELRTALELRDQQLVQVGNQLLADRKLYGETDMMNESGKH